MIFEGAQLRERTARSEEAIARLSDGGVRFIQMEMPDINGTVRGKIASLDKGLGPTGTAISTLMMNARSGDEVVLTFWCDLDNGFPKMVAVPDLSTVARWSWQPDTAAVLCDSYMEDGSPCPLDGRLILKRVLAEYEAEGLEPRAALEWEVYLYEVDDDLQRARRFRELKPFGRDWDFYSVQRFPSFAPLAREFMDRMASVDAPVEAFHTEYGNGQFEWTTIHATALKAADDGSRGKLYLRQLADEHGLVASYMPAQHAGTADSKSGCHHNLSVWRDGHNLFWDGEARTLTPLARQMAAGIMATMSDLHLLFRPWVNSHRRMDRFSWNPEDASWALDHHSVAIRVVHGANPAKYTRFEHRAPGPDVNPYLSLAAMLWGGLVGIRERMEPPEYAAGDPMASGRYDVLPHTLAESTEAFRKSSVARDLLGDVFVEHFAQMKDAEARAFEEWATAAGAEFPGDSITDWEFDHYFRWA